MISSVVMSHERDVRRVPELGVLHHVGRLRSDPGASEQVTDPHARPRRVEFAPFGDAVDVERREIAGIARSSSRVIREGKLPSTSPMIARSPLAGFVVGHVADVQDREAIGEYWPGGRR